MVYVSVRQTVEDFKVWRPTFDGDAARRKAGGGTGNNVVYRDVENPNLVTVILEWDNLANLEKFLHDPALAEAMKKAGAVGAPAITIMNRA